MKDEVEDFLRRVAQMRAQAEAQAKGQQRPPPQQQRPAPPQKPPRQKPPARLVPARQETPPPPLTAEVVDAELADQADRVARRVSEDLRGTEQIVEHARHLGEDVDAADEKMAAHLHQVFDHQLGHLKSTGGPTALVARERSASELSLDQIMRMFRAPDSVRDAIVMSEILRRPEQLW